MRTTTIRTPNCVCVCVFGVFALLCVECFYALIIALGYTMIVKHRSNANCLHSMFGSLGSRHYIHIAHATQVTSSIKVDAGNIPSIDVRAQSYSKLECQHLGHMLDVTTQPTTNGESTTHTHTLSLSLSRYGVLCDWV
jgi:hypothetical protein